MTFNYRFGRVSVLLSAVAAAGMPPAFAQQPAAPASERRAALEEIVVTAQRREERLQDAPLSVAAFSGDELHDRGLGSIKDLQAGGIPSVRIAPFFGRASAVSLSMRGIASGDVTQISRDPSFGIYVDGVYLGRVQGLGVELLDLERMEVLRGPQGTLFGRNAVGGAVNMVSRRPAGEFGLRQRVGVSNFGGRNMSTSLDLPRMGDVSIKVDGLLSQRDGWVENPYTDPRENFGYNYEEKEGLRVSALWEPNERFDALYSYDISRDRSTSGYPHLSAFIDDRDQAPLMQVEDGRVDDARFGAPLRPSVARVEGHTLNMSYALTDQLTFRSITSYRELEQTQRDQWAGAFFGINFGGVGLTGRYSLAEVNQDQFSQEFQLLGSTPRLDYVLGAFWFEEDANDSADTLIPLRFIENGTAVLPLDPPILSPSRASVADARSRALFAQATWTPPVLEDRLDVTVGLRYTDDRKTGELTSIGGTPPDPANTFRFTSDRFDPAITFDYRWSESVSTYLRWATAYRAGGANSRSVSFNPFDEEEVTAWEIGLKSEFWQNRARLNMAAYHTDYDDLQFTFTDPSNPSVSETVNTPDTVEIRGLEVDLHLIPLPGLQFDASYSYTDVDSPALTNPFPPNPTFQPRGGLAPKHAASAAVGYEFEPMSYGTWRLHLDSTYSSGNYIGALSDRKTDSYVLFNGRVTLDDIRVGPGDSSLALAFWVRNIFDNEYTYFNATLDGSNFTGVDVDWYGTPRTYGLELTLRM